MIFQTQNQVNLFFIFQFSVSSFGGFFFKIWRKTAKMQTKNSFFPLVYLFASAFLTLLRGGDYDFIRLSKFPLLDNTE